jgi:hypothetical protein
LVSGISSKYDDGRAHFVGHAQRLHHHALVVSADGDDALAARHHQPGDGELVLRPHRLAQHRERLLRHRAVRREVVRRVLVDLRHFLGVDEGLDIQRMVGLDLHRFEVLVLDDDVLLVLVLVAAHQVGALHQTQLGVHRLHVDPVVRVLVELVERDPLARTRRRIEPHRAAHEAEFDITLPACTGCHCSSLLEPGTLATLTA